MVSSTQQQQQVYHHLGSSGLQNDCFAWNHGLQHALDPSMHSALESVDPLSRTQHSTTLPSPTLSQHDHFLLSLPSQQSSSSSTRPTATPGSTSEAGMKRSSPSSEGECDGEPTKVQKRQKNTEAARRYRQRKVDRVTELEEALKVVSEERDELKLRLARAEAMSDVLKGMVGKSG
ncbi:unnamed protein product [Zymoseptoria tritici ST99CH_3D1]|nr:unnamed protein product [Zymoseptoria tritici ST99CH_3D1]